MREEARMSSRGEQTIDSTLILSNLSLSLLFETSKNQDQSLEIKNWELGKLSNKWPRKRDLQARKRVVPAGKLIDQLKDSFAIYSSSLSSSSSSSSSNSHQDCLTVIQIQLDSWSSSFKLTSFNLEGIHRTACSLYAFLMIRWPQYCCTHCCCRCSINVHMTK